VVGWAIYPTPGTDAGNSPSVPPIYSYSRATSWTLAVAIGPRLPGPGLPAWTDCWMPLPRSSWRHGERPFSRNARCCRGCLCPAWNLAEWTAGRAWAAGSADSDPDILCELRWTWQCDMDLSGYMKHGLGPRPTSEHVFQKMSTFRHAAGSVYTTTASFARRTWNSKPPIH